MDAEDRCSASIGPDARRPRLLVSALAGTAALLSADGKERAGLAIPARASASAAACLLLASDTTRHLGGRRCACLGQNRSVRIVSRVTLASVPEGALGRRDLPRFAGKRYRRDVGAMAGGGMIRPWRIGRSMRCPTKRVEQSW